jgi:hypothetical protein
MSQSNVTFEGNPEISSCTSPTTKMWDQQTLERQRVSMLNSEAHIKAFKHNTKQNFLQEYLLLRLNLLLNTYFHDSSCVAWLCYHNLITECHNYSERLFTETELL